MFAQSLARVGQKMVLAQLALVLLAACSGEIGHANALAKVSALLHKENLVAEARLAPDFLGQTMGLLSSGEAILVTYRFVLYKQRNWLPDEEIGATLVRRRLRRNLILERYEMQEIGDRYLSFTADDQEAARFLGHPRFVPVAPHHVVDNKNTYLIEVWFQLDEEGVTRMLRVLRSWVFFWEHNAHTLQSEFKRP